MRTSPNFLEQIASFVLCNHWHNFVEMILLFCANVVITDLSVGFRHLAAFNELEDFRDELV